MVKLTLMKYAITYAPEAKEGLARECNPFHGFIQTFIFFVYSKTILNFAIEIKWITFMGVKKITHEEALRRWKHSLEIKRKWERRVAERWANEDQQKSVS